MLISHTSKLVTPIPRNPGGGGGRLPAATINASHPLLQSLTKWQAEQWGE